MFSQRIMRLLADRTIVPHLGEISFPQPGTCKLENASCPMKHRTVIEFLPAPLPATRAGIHLAPEALQLCQGLGSIASSQVLQTLTDQLIEGHPTSLGELLRPSEDLLVD